MTLPTRTLKDYRPQHDDGCNAVFCATCSAGKGWWQHKLETTSAGCHPFTPKPCSCGLDQLLAEFDAPGAQERCSCGCPAFYHDAVGRCRSCHPDDCNLGAQERTAGPFSHTYMADGLDLLSKPLCPACGGELNEPVDDEDVAVEWCSTCGERCIVTRKQMAVYSTWIEGMDSKESDPHGAQERTTEKNDHGAGLIGPTIPDMVGTEARLNKSEK